ncbi:MAG: cytochrome c [Betaproteobacteria bacterium]|nr:cytochrome c [Betaproteobacteria bacterium]
MKQTAALLMTLALTTSAWAADGLPSTDNRVAIPVSAKERENTLYEMRTLLHGLFNIHTALSRNDMKGVAVAARSMSPLISRIPPSVRDRLPTEFMEMGNALKETWETIARDAEQKQNAPHTQAQLAEVMAYCSGCHDSFQFKVVSGKSRNKR